MSLASPIGGFFELELSAGEVIHADAILLNSGRNCFEYILRANRVTRIYLPRYTCDAMLAPLQKLEIPYTFYAINAELEIDGEITLKAGEMLVYNNYFGLKDSYCRALANKYQDRLIIDASQAYYFQPPVTSHTFFSPRKFFGTSDGGCLVTSVTLNEPLPFSTSFDRTSHLIKRIDVGAEEAYAEFTASENNLGQEPLSQMSQFTRRLLGSINYTTVKTKRLENYALLHNRLEHHNQFRLELGSSSCPMVYPLISKVPNLRQRLIEQKVFVATYWPNVMEWCDEDALEYHLAKNIMPLPIDQRYGEAEMNIILNLIEVNS